MMRLIMAGALLAASPVALAAQDAPAGGWNSAFATTEAGHLVGNPEAETNLIAFVSYSCPHCANFEKQSDAPLRLGYIQPGKVSLEVRHVIRNPLDLAAALVTECGDEEDFFARHRAMMLSHDEWMQTAREATPEQQERWRTGDLGSRMRAIAADLGFYELMEQRGLSVAQIDRCLSDETRAAELAENSQAQSARFNIAGTPSFVVNGELLEGVHNWAALQQVLDQDS